MSEQVAPYRELRPLRRLLPLPAKRPLSHAESSTAQPHVASQRPKTGRAYHNQVAAACDACRKQKSKVISLKLMSTEAEFV